MKRAYIWVVLLSLLSIRLTADACSCSTGPPSYEFNRARAVFVGTMLGGTETHSEQDQNGAAYSRESGEVRFAVEEVFKGTLSGEVTIQIGSMKGTSRHISAIS